MDTDRILSELKTERDRIDQAITALAGLYSTGQRQTIRRTPKATASPRERGQMSAAARRRLSQLLKQRWAAGKMRPRAKATSAKPARGMSQAARNRMAAAQRARWAKVKAQKKA